MKSGSIELKFEEDVMSNGDLLPAWVITRIWRAALR